MKKLVMFLVFILLMTFIVAFNYLLWDRDTKIKELSSLEGQSASKTISMDAQKREIDRLSEENEVLKRSVSALESDKKVIIEEMNKVINDKAEAYLDLEGKIASINILKKTAYPEEMITPVREWVKAVNEGNYKLAYDLEYGGLVIESDAMSIQEFTSRLETYVKNIDFKSYEIDPKKGLEDGDVYLRVLLGVTLKPKVEEYKSPYKPGNNDVTVHIGYNPDTKSFYIDEMIWPRQ
jgi:cell division protein FtsB